MLLAVTDFFFQIYAPNYTRFLKVCVLKKNTHTQNKSKIIYRIYAIKRPGRLLKFWPMRVGAYSRLAVIQGWALIKFSPFSARGKFIL